MTRASCKECPSSYELIPPADTDYSVPREKPKTEDYIQRIYECAEEGHRNTIYWEKEEHIMMSTKRQSTDDWYRSKLRFNTLMSGIPLNSTLVVAS